MEHTIRMDWLTVSGKIVPREGDNKPVGIAGYAEFAREVLGDIQKEAPTLKTIPTARFYDWSFQDVRSGSRVHMSEDTLGQGFKVECSGTVCHKLKDISIINSVVETRKMKVTRFDYAVDVIDGGWHPGECYDAYVLEHGKGGQKKITYHNRIDNHGFQLGTNESERSLIVYDKGLEQGVPVDWKRIEMEYHKGYAQYAFETFCDYPLALCGDVCKFIRVPNCPASKALQAISLGAVAEKYLRAVSVPDKEKWLRGTVLRSFTKMCMEDEEGAMRVFADFQDTMVAARFATALGLEFDKIPKNGDNSSR